jgi:hypothetical protein
MNRCTSLARLRQARDTARYEQDRAEQLLMALVTQVLSPERKRFLFDAGVTEWDVLTVNQVLAQFGVRVRCEARATERQVKVRLREDGALATRAAFWIQQVDPAVLPVVVDGDEDESEDNAQGTQ